MTSPVFSSNGGSGIFSRLKGLKDAIGGNPQAVFDQMYSSNPEFRDFANSMRGKSPEQAFKEKGYDYSQVRKMMGR